VTSEDTAAFDRHLDATAPAVAEIARALRLAVLAGLPDAVGTFDRGDGLLDLGPSAWLRALPRAGHGGGAALGRRDIDERMTTSTLPIAPNRRRAAMMSGTGPDDDCG
jgi:hypothetical protein